MKTVRIRFSKTGRAKFISHLDLNRTMSRAFRRAGIPLWYTEGFNRRPYITFAAPLSLGFEGLRECMDIRLLQDMPMEELVDRLNAVMPEGLRALEAAEAVMKPGDLTEAKYQIILSCPPEAVAELLEQDSIPIEKTTKKGGSQQIDLKPYLAAADITGQDGATLIDIYLPLSASQSVNPSLIVQAVSQHLGKSLSARVTRLELYGKNRQIYA